MGDVLNQGEIEQGIIEICDRLDELVNDYAVQCENAANAESTYRVRFYRALLAHKDQSRVETGRAMSDKEAEARATVAAENELRTYKIAAALVDSSKQAQLSQRARLDALRTLSANVRAST